MIRYFYNINLFKKLLIYFILVFIIPVIVVGGISVYLSIKTTSDSAIQFSLATLEQVKIRIETLFEDARTVALQTASDANIQNTLRKPLEKDLSKKYALDLSMDTYLNFDSTYRNNIYAYYIIGTNFAKYKSAYNSVLPGDLTQTDWYIRVISSDEPVWFSSHVDSFAVQTSGQSFISYAASIKDRASSNKLGVVLVDIELEKLNKILLDSFGNTGRVLIVDSNNSIVSSSAVLTDLETETALKALSLPQQDITEPYILDSGNSIILSKQLSTNNWKIIGVLPSRDLLKNNIISIYLLIIVVVIISFISFFLSIIFAASITKPINNIMSLMKKVESGNLDVQMDILYNDEIGQLSKSFNKMIIQVKELMNKVYEEQKKLRRYELRALQAQINPHFLYNTLDSVVWLARMKQNEQIVDIVNAMTRLFRISLSKGKDIIPISEEIDHVLNYLTIQKFRYKSKFEYIIDIPESINNYKTPKLILQPLVENAIYHGVKLKREVGKITIRAYNEQTTIVFEVEDTGKGMESKTVEAIQKALNSNEQTEVPMYGIKNVHERIQIFFGKQYGLTFKSTYGVGTIARVIIPKYMGEEINAKNNSN